MTKTKIKLKLTIEERILLHIRDYSRHEHDLQAPFALTQDGIAEAVSVVRSAIPRSMKKLVDKGLVKEQVGHVEGVVRRRKIYYLTTAGLVRGQEITEKLEMMKCSVKNMEGEVKEFRISEVNKFLHTNYSILEILGGMDENGLFDYPSYVASKSKKESEEIGAEAFLAFTGKAPKLGFFTGRVKELETLRDWLDGEDRKVIVVHGLAGMGKTTLALKIMEEYRSSRHLVWYRFHPWDTLRYFIKNLAQFLSQIGRRELQRHLDSEPLIDLNEVGEIVEEGLKGLNVLIIVDDFHKARTEILPIFSLFVEMLELIDGVKLLLFSRNIVPFYDRRHVRVKNIVGELLLEGLTMDAASELLDNRGLSEIDLNTAYTLTAGHPLSLELLEKNTDTKSSPDKADLDIYIQEEIFSRLPDFERRLLEYASVYRHRIPKENLLEQAEGGYQTLNDLSSRALLEYSHGKYTVHDLIREFFYDNLSASKQKEYHNIASAYYLKTIEESNWDSDVPAAGPVDGIETQLESGVTDEPSATGMTEMTGEVLSATRSHKLGTTVIEALYHLIKSDRAKEAGELAANYGDSLIELDLAEELKELIDQLPLDRLEGKTLALVMAHLAEICNHFQNYDMAKNYYIEAIEKFRIIHGEAKEPKRMARLYRRLGFIYERRNEWEASKEHHEKSLELAEKGKDALAISDAYGALGWLSWNMGDHDKANDYYNKCIGMADQIADMPGKAKVYLGICMALAKRGELEEALVYYEKCLEILERNEDIFKLARSYEGMGDHYLRSIFSEVFKSANKR